MATMTPEMPVPTPPSKSAFERLIGVFFSPGETFADIARSPGFVLPLGLIMIMSLTSSVIITNRVGMENIVRQQMMKSPRTAEMPKEQLEQAVERGAKFGAYFAYAAPVFAAIGLLIIAGALLMMANFVFGGASSFKQMFGVVTHASFPPVLLTVILSVVIVMLKDDPTDLDVQNLVAANLGVLISAETSKFLHRLAISMDLFSFWQMGLLATGISTASNLSFSKSLVAVAIPWALWVLCASGLAAAF